MSAANSNAAPPGGSVDQAAVARQLLRDMEALQKRRHELEHKIKVRDVAVFAMETTYLQMTTTPFAVVTDPIGIANNSQKAGQIRDRDGTVVKKDDDDAKKKPVTHLGAIQLGDGAVSDEGLSHRVTLADRMFSLSNFTALSTCGKTGMIAQ